MAVVIPADFPFFFFLASRALYIFAWKLVGGEMQLAIVYFVTILL